MSSKRRYRSNLRKQLDFQRLEPRQLLASLGNGQEIVSSVGVGETEEFEIEITAGQTVDISVGETSNSAGPSPRLTIFAPNGSEVGAATGSVDANLEFIATQSGTYTAVVEDDARDTLLNFRIRALTLPGTPELIAGRDQALANGEEAISSVPEGGFALFPVEVLAGQTVDISVGETSNSAGPSPRLTIFAPNGSEIGTATGSVDANLEFIATQSGTYTAVVEDDARDTFLSFRIRALTLPGTPELIVGRDQALANGEEAISSVPEGGFALFPVEVLAGQTVDISVGETSNSAGPSPRLTIFAPNGSEIGTATGSIDASLEFIATQSGTYTAVVEDDDRDTFLQFGITATGISQLPPEVIRLQRDGQANELIELLARPDQLNVVEISFNQDVDVRQRLG